MDFQILGPLEVRREGRPVSLRAAKQRALLAILLLHAGEVVSRDRLIEGLWGQTPPETAAHALQVYVAQLRKALEPGRARGAPHEIVLTRAPGYLVSVDPGRVDAVQFERLLAEGRTALAAGATAAAAQQLHEALALWRGPALADFAYEPFAQGEIARLEELRLAALEERLEADLALGTHTQLIGELEALVRDHPLRERLRGQLMLALYRSGRQAEALEAYQQAHRTLDEELGIAPGPVLRRLQQEILSQDPALEGPPEAVADPAPQPAALVREGRKTVTVLVAGRAAQPGVDAGTLRRLDELHRKAASLAIERHGGMVESVVANRVVGAFGVFGAREDDPLRAARAAIGLLDALRGDSERGNGSGERTAGRVGVSTGDVVTGESAPAGAPLGGEAMTLAAELADAAPAGQILLDQRTRRLLGDAVRAEPLEDSHEAVWRLFELIAPPPPLARLPESPIVGREGELAQLRQVLDRAAREATVHLFTILGSAGIGKSRLAEEFASGVAEDATVVAGRCVPYGEGITFWPLREVVERVTAAAPLSQLLESEEDGPLVAARVNEAIGHTDASSSLEEIFWAFRRLLETLARDRPLVVVFEDVHWAEPTLLDFIDYVAERGRGAPILLLCLARPELLEGRPGWGGGIRNVGSFQLEPLSGAESEQLIDTLATGLSMATRARVLETAEGNPLFLEQILAMLAEGVAPDGELPIPPTIQAVLAARLDRLGPGERAVMESAAVVGKEFWEQAVAHLLPAEARRFATLHLDALVQKELLQPLRPASRGDVAFRFRHVLIQQATYRTIPEGLRATLHERVAAWLEQNFGGGSAEHAERAGYHLEQSYRHRVELGPVTEEDLELARHAADLLASAGRRAYTTGDMPAAAALLSRARALAEDGRARAELTPDLATALVEVGDFAQAATVVEDGLEQAHRMGDERLAARTELARIYVTLQTHPGMASRELEHDIRRAMQVLEAAGDDLGLARGWGMIGRIEHVCCCFAAAEVAVQNAVVHAQRAGAIREELEGIHRMGVILVYGPTPIEVGRRRALDLLERYPDDVTLLADLGGSLAHFAAAEGRFDEARELVRRERERHRDIGRMVDWAATSQGAATIELLAGDAAAAERLLTDGCEVLERFGETSWLSSVLALLGMAVLEQGRIEEAERHAERSRLISLADDIATQVGWRSVCARVLVVRGQMEAAERMAREAVSLTAGSDSVLDRTAVRETLAHVLAAAGRHGEAATELRRALELYEAKGELVKAGRLRERLESLARARGA